MSDMIKNLDALIEYMNDNPAVFGWKSRYEAVIELAERLERENAGLRKRTDELEWILQLLDAGRIRDYKYACQHRSDCLCWPCQMARINAALEAAKGGK